MLVLDPAHSLIIVFNPFNTNLILRKGQSMTFSNKGNKLFISCFFSRTLVFS